MSKITSDLHNLQENWNKLGNTDTFWSILTDQKWNTSDFFLTGENEVNLLMKKIISSRLTIQKEKALDFGCGVGRISQALGRYFKKVYGVDISPSMIKLANKYNKFEKRCTYYLNSKADLSLFPNNTFDFIFSFRTLQHMNPIFIKKYIREFLRILKPCGLLIFQLPTVPTLNLKGLFIRITPIVILNRLRKMEMHGISKKEIIEIINKNKTRIIKIIEDNSSGSGWISFQYWITKYSKA